MNPSPSLARQRIVLALTIGAVVLAFSLAALSVLQRHREMQARLDELEPRYARLAGLDQQRAEIDAVRTRVREARARYLFPSAQDAAQTGNAVQQRLREIFAAAGLQVVSSQVLPAKEEKGFDRIPLVLTAEGDLMGLQSVLAELQRQSPVIALQDFDVTVQGGLGSTKPTVQPRLSMQFNLDVLRESS